MEPSWTPSPLSYQGLSLELASIKLALAQQLATHENLASLHCLDPVTLSGEGEFDLNIIKEVEITDSFMGLSLNDRKCQNEENFVDCTTRHGLGNILLNCGCLPLSIGSFTNNVKAGEM